MYDQTNLIHIPKYKFEIYRNKKYDLVKRGVLNPSRSGFSTHLKYLKSIYY